MKETFASAEDLRPLYTLMDKVKALAPWDWLEESDLFGVEHPETGELGFVSIMGMAGEHYAISVYQGADALYSLLEFVQIENLTAPQMLLEIPQLQAAFEDRNMTAPEDRAMLKKLGLKYRGSHAWPTFRCIRPGFVPYFVTPEEAKFLGYALEQVLEVAPRAKENPDLLYPGEEDDEDLRLLIRVAQTENGSLTWHDEIRDIPPPPPKALEVVMDLDLLEQAKSMPQRRLAVETDLYMMPSHFGDRGERPHFAYLLLMVDANSGMIIGFQILQPLPSLEDMWSQLALITLTTFVERGVIPSEIRVRHPVLAVTLKPLAQALKLKFREQDDLPFLDEALEGMGGMFGLSE